ncbi:phage-related minor tail protein [Erythromicrobium ramosum]|uniref:Phage-related minor tail protein n=1 Tax=Erythrobacter ramosus TaxID=35811 RepID=A0A6I4UF72_9SPHN|nr:tail tape measure protein [Erythrobacter ramosus]MBB3774837.1 phage-related minor tail protein [Erythrobacter ramosus]MXP37522.1 tail tape measure protein [Erythrobacter ramosus]
MTDNFEELVIDVRASTDGFASDVEAMRRTLDGSLLDGFSRAGNVLERGLLGALRRGSLGFDDLKRVAFSALAEIAGYALQSGIGNLFGGTSGGAGGLGNLLGQSIGALFGLPGRATGGPVAPGRAYLVGERGPELFVPTAAGRVETGMAAPGRDVRVAIQVAVPRGQAAPTAMQRSSRQIASAVRRALQQA